jgi:hypothetical protein
MDANEWCVEKNLTHGRRRCRHIPTKCVFDLWIADGEVRAVLRQGAASSELFSEAKEWFWRFGKEQKELL